MKSIKINQTQLQTLCCGLLCLLAGVMCIAKGFSHNSANQPAAVSATPGERQGISPPCPSPLLCSAGKPQFTSLTPRYVTKRIADLEVGEEVVAKDPESGEVTPKRVANVFRKVSDHLRILQVRNPLTNEMQTIETTDDHPFWVAALGQWIDAKDLKLGDRLDDVDGGTAILESTSRELPPEGIPVFNFEVEDFHTYFVRAHGSRGPPVLTHNTECGPDGFVSIGSFENAARNGTNATSTAFHDSDWVEQAAANAGRSEDIALGFYKLYSKNGQLSQTPIGASVESLRPFAEKTSARAYWEWGDLNPDIVGMRRGVVGAAHRAVDNGGKIHFNLDGFRNKGTSFRDAVARGKSGIGKITEHELYWILSDRRLRDNAVFYRSGRVLENSHKLFGPMWNTN